MLTFLLIQGVLAVYNVDVIRDAIDRNLVNGYPSALSSLPPRLLNGLFAAGITYVGFSLSGIAIAHRGHRVLFMSPAVTYVLASVALGPIHQPQSLGHEWEVQCFEVVCAGPWFAHPWLGPFVDLALVLLPGWLVSSRVRARRWPPTTDPPTVVAILAAAALLALAAWTTAVIQARLDVPAIAAVGALGIALGTARPWWPWLHVLFATLVTGSLVFLLGATLLPSPGYSVVDSLPYIAEVGLPVVVMGLLASAWQPLAWLFRRSKEQPLQLLVAVNLLNLIDAVMTAAAVRSGKALEANPLIRFGGLPAKVLFVSLLTWPLYRKRPSALVWPGAVFLCVVCYHLSGFLVSG